MYCSDGKQSFFSTITPVLSVTWSFILICYFDAQETFLLSMLKSVALLNNFVETVAQL